MLGVEQGVPVGISNAGKVRETAQAEVGVRRGDVGHGVAVGEHGLYVRDRLGELKRRADVVGERVGDPADGVCTGCLSKTGGDNSGAHGAVRGDWRVRAEGSTRAGERRHVRVHDGFRAAVVPVTSTLNGGLSGDGNVGDVEDTVESRGASGVARLEPGLEHAPEREALADDFRELRDVSLRELGVNLVRVLQDILQVQHLEKFDDL